ncbi:hypothetical protein Hanom_Chr17g01584211 [Helianthus anomalus]
MNYYIQEQNTKKSSGRNICRKKTHSMFSPGDEEPDSFCLLGCGSPNCRLTEISWSSSFNGERLSALDASDFPT